VAFCLTGRHDAEGPPPATPPGSAVAGRNQAALRLRIRTDGSDRPPRLLRDDRVDLVTLSAMARTIDQISREDGRDWPAVRFVEWLKSEWRASVAVATTEATVDEAA
jgi:hypothetical protein